MRQRRSVSARSITWSGVDPSNCWFGRCNHWPITFASMISASASSNRLLSRFFEVTLVQPILHVVWANVHRGQLSLGWRRGRYQFLSSTQEIAGVDPSDGTFSSNPSSWVNHFCIKAASGTNQIPHFFVELPAVGFELLHKPGVMNR